ncbi:hypothetical protein R1flu_006404 [Riccia fluitans]|uniref:Uncharacterized protein n=1 Tax=Riccia fluitans TaxID=41844 RepID=A0ABD1YVX5_9MARC
MAASIPPVSPWGGPFSKLGICCERIVVTFPLGICAPRHPIWTQNSLSCAGVIIAQHHGRRARKRIRHGIARPLGIRAVSSEISSSALPFSSVRMLLSRTRPACLEHGFSVVPLRFFALTQLYALETTEENDWQKKVEFLVSCSFTKEQAVQVLKQCSVLLSLSLEEELQPKVVFLRSLGVRDLPKVILFSPNLLLGRLEMNLMPKVAFFESFGIQRQSIGKIIERFPTVLTYSIEGNMMSKTKFLESIGLERESIAKVIMRSPYIFALSIEENMRPKVNLLETIGVDKKYLSKLITRCPKIFCLSNEDNVLPKIKYLESIGVEKESMGKIVATCPSILNLSTSHIQQKLDFLQTNNYSVKKVVNEFPGNAEKSFGDFCIQGISTSSGDCRVIQLS